MRRRTRGGERSARGMGTRLSEVVGRVVNPTTAAERATAGADRASRSPPPRGRATSSAFWIQTVALSLMSSLMGIFMELSLPHHLVGIDLSTDAARRTYLESMADLFLYGLEVD